MIEMDTFEQGGQKHSRSAAILWHRKIRLMRTG
jgi:hypothetical protein